MTEPSGRLQGRGSGFALIAVLLVVMIFFIITVAISSCVALQARAYYETSMADMSGYMADAGVKMAHARAMYRFFMRDSGTYDVYSHDLYSTGMLPSLTSDFKTSLLIDVYDLQPTASTVDSYYDFRNTVKCTANIYDHHSCELIAQRTVFADIYLGDRISSASIPDGLIKSKVKRYFDENR